MGRQADDTPRSPKGPGSEAREKRLAAALRANLRRRKAQAEQREPEAQGNEKDPAEGR